MSSQEQDPRAPRIEDFERELPRQVAPWRWLWEGDHRFPVRSHRRVLGRLLVAIKRALHPLVRTPLNDLWDRQRLFNLVQLEWLEGVREDLVKLQQQNVQLRQKLEEVNAHFERRLDGHESRLDRLESFLREGLGEVMRHNDALFSRVDQKLDRYQRGSRELRAKLGAALALAEEQGLSALVEAHREWDYLQLENRYRGTEEEIRTRLSQYLPYLSEVGTVLDLGCGRGEALELLRQAGVSAQGVDSSGEMVAHCREKGLEAVEGDLFQHLADLPAGSIGGVLSFHVIEHLPGASLERLARLAWRALRPGGVLILETPNPLSILVASRNFWLDPTHTRPVHPGYLRLCCELAGFDPVEQLQLRPFPVSERLPEIPLEELDADQRQLADRVNRLRDRIDVLLFGWQDYAVVAHKAASDAPSTSG